MKTIILFTCLFLSLNSFSAEHGYWINSVTCGEIDPMVIGDGCLLEVQNKNEHYVILVRGEEVMEDINTYGENTDVLVELSARKKLSREEREALRRIVPDRIRVYSISYYDIRFSDLSDAH